jgi:cellulose synthase/poly-beta-1,6-N-acetylglucosamine synthase-like glycosyltransferase
VESAALLVPLLVLLVFATVSRVRTVDRVRAARPLRTDLPDGRRAAVVVATRNGERTIAQTVASARDQVDVYVVSDGSTDGTAAAARLAGAVVLELAENVGKPAAIHRALAAFDLLGRYDAIAILDDDTVVAPDFMRRALLAMKPGIGIVCGRTITRWDAATRWNVFVGSRAFAYWRYQAGLRRGQSAVNAMTCISGSNSVYTTDVLREVIVEQTPYSVDDTWWTLETVRRGLGRIVYAPAARAWICDPLTLRDWWRQNVRWNWAMFQGIWGHRVGRQARWFDVAYVLLILDWCLYVFAAPVCVVLIAVTGWGDPVRFALWYAVGVFAWVAVAAIATRSWRLVVMTPAIVLIDWIYRVTFLHALVKAVGQPRVEICRWESPARY